MNLYEEIEKIKEQGDNEANAQSKLGQDIVLKAIYDSGMARKDYYKTVSCINMPTRYTLRRGDGNELLSTSGKAIYVAQ